MQQAARKPQTSQPPQQHAQQPLQQQPIQPGMPQAGVAQKPQVAQQIQQPVRDGPVGNAHGNLIDFNSDSSHQALPPQRQLNNDNHMHPGLQQPLQPEHPLVRQDSNTREVDEFVDAPDGQ